MTSKKNKARSPKEANPKKFKKKTSVLVTEKVEFIDYKDVNLLTRFVSDRSKIRNRRVTGNTVQQQREIANAIKNAREMALIPYTKRVPRPAPAARRARAVRVARAVTARAAAIATRRRTRRPRMCAPAPRVRRTSR